MERIPGRTLSEGNDAQRKKKQPEIAPAASLSVLFLTRSVVNAETNSTRSNSQSTVTMEMIVAVIVMTV